MALQFTWLLFTMSQILQTAFAIVVIWELIRGIGCIFRKENAQKVAEAKDSWKAWSNQLFGKEDKKIDESESKLTKNLADLTTKHEDLAKLYKSLANDIMVEGEGLDKLKVGISHLNKYVENTGELKREEVRNFIKNIVEKLGSVSGEIENKLDHIRKTRLTFSNQEKIDSIINDLEKNYGFLVKAKETQIDKLSKVLNHKKYSDEQKKYIRHLIDLINQSLADLEKNKSFFVESCKDLKNEYGKFNDKLTTIDRADGTLKSSVNKLNADLKKLLDSLNSIEDNLGPDKINEYSTATTNFSVAVKDIAASYGVLASGINSFKSFIGGINNSINLVTNYKDNVETFINKERLINANCNKHIEEVLTRTNKIKFKELR
ncbi:MAG: hypothetical protein ACLFN8_03970 [Candidatus Woesearchaeota archaeon]